MNTKVKSTVSMWVVVFLSFASLAAVGGDLSVVEAVQRGDGREAIRSLLQQVDANETQADGATALAWAVHRNDLESAELLIQAGADVNAPNDHGVTPLSLACANIQNAAMVKKLLEAGGNPNSAQVKGETVLMTCSRTGNAEAIKLLLAHGVEVDVKEPWRWQTALMWAAAKKHANVVALLVENGADVHAQTRGKFTPLMFAAQQGDVDSARILLTAGADVNQVSPHGSALLVASASSREQTAIFLLEQGADPNVVDVYGNTPLHYAVRQGFSELDGIRYDVNRPRPSNMPVLAQALIASGADVNVRIKEFLKMRDDRPPIDITGATPFFLAAVSVDAPLMKLLADNGADIRMSVNEKTTPLIAAAMGACPGECRGMGKNEQNKEWEAKAFAAVKMAVELGADVNAANDTGQTAMHIAAFTGSDSIIQLLADKGAAVDPVAASGETPWTMAMGISANLGIRGTYGHHKSTVALLLKLGAKVRGREGMDPRGRLALVGNVGAEDGETEVIDPNENQQYP